FHAGTFQYGAHGTTGQYARTANGWLDQYVASRILAILFVRHGTLDDRHFDEVFLGVVDAFGDGFGHFLGLAQPEAYHAVLVADDHDGGEAERTAALGDFSHALDAYQAVLQFDLAGFYSFYI